MPFDDYRCDLGRGPDCPYENVACGRKAIHGSHDWKKQSGLGAGSVRRHCDGVQRTVQ
jgi:hypothetical protein